MLAAQKKLPAITIPELFNGSSRRPEHFDIVVNLGIASLKRSEPDCEQLNVLFHGGGLRPIHAQVDEPAERGTIEGLAELVERQADALGLCRSTTWVRATARTSNSPTC